MGPTSSSRLSPSLFWASRPQFSFTDESSSKLLPFRGVPLVCVQVTKSWSRVCPTVFHWKVSTVLGKGWYKTVCITQILLEIRQLSKHPDALCIFFN